MKPHYLLLRGFWGIKNGLGLDQVEVHFDQLPNGIIIFSGENGAGKTTIMDNLHHYRIMPSKIEKKYTPDSFNYYEETYGHDACKIYISEMEGRLIKTVLNIDAVQRKQECFLYEERQGRNIELNSDGKAGSYDRAVEEIFGSPELFFMSQFKTQGAKNLWDYSKGNVIEILTELFGNSRLKERSEAAGKIRKALVTHVSYLQKECRALTEICSEKDVRQEELVTGNGRLKAIKERLESLQNEIRMKENEARSIELKLSLQENETKRKAKLAENIETIENKIVGLKEREKARTSSIAQKIKGIEEKLTSIAKEVSRLSAHRRDAERGKELEGKLKTLKASLEACDRDISALNDKMLVLAKHEALLNKKEEQLKALRREQTHRIELIITELAGMEKEIMKLNNLPCLDSAVESYAQMCVFVKDAFAAKEKIPATRADLEKARIPDPMEDTLEAKIMETKAVVSKKPLVEKNKAERESERQSLSQEIKACEEGLEKCRESFERVSEIELAVKMKPEYENELNQLRKEKETAAQEFLAEIGSLKRDIAAIKDEAEGIVVDDRLERSKEAITSEIDELRATLENERTREAESVKQIGAIEEALKNIARTAIRLTEMQSKVEILNKEIADWYVLELGFGDKGIIALEIDDAGPSVSARANELLRIYGTRYSLRLDTQKPKSKGTALKEAFDVTVFDSKSNSQKSIKKVSGGQDAYIGDCVAKAICINNKIASGRDFRTIFTDERDGGLDPAKRKEFFNMKRAVLKLGGYDQEYCITHSPELLSFADAVITLSDGRVDVTMN